MAAARDAAGRFAAIGYQWSYTQAILDLKADIQAGRLAFARTDRAYALNPVFHVDASADNGSVMTDPYGYVTNWADVRFNGRWAAATNSLINNAPNLLLNALGGRPVIDFNYYGYASSAPASYSRTSHVTERYLSWNAEIANIRTAFWLLGSQNGGGFLLGHTDGYNFHRGAATWGDSTEPGLFNGDAAEGVKNGRIFVDGLKLDSYWQRGVLNGGYQLVQLVTTANAAANQFSRDRKNLWQCGGQRLGEVVLFNYALTEKERMNMEALLAAKWFGDLRRVALADGAVLDTGTGTGNVMLAALEGAGTARREGAATLRVLDGAAFSGILETRLDRLDVSHLESPAQPAPNPSLWLDASRPGGVTVDGTIITGIRDFSANNLPIGFTGANPVLRTDELNGRPVIDLGPAVAGGTALTFDGTRAKVLSAFAVHGSQEGGGCFLGAATTWPFYREFSTALGTANPYTPPADFQDFVDYAVAVAERYRDRIQYYQVWNEPNLYPEWGDQTVNAEAYTELLCRTYDALKAVDPAIVVITGALGPTVDLSGRNAYDLLYLQRMYQAGAGRCFDILSVQGYGLWSGPTDRRLRPVTINYQRHLLIRDMMVANGDAHKPIWISEAGWNPVPNDPAIADLERYGRATMDEAAAWAPLAYERARQEWPWIGMIAWWYFKPASDANQGQSWYYFRMVEPDFTPTPVYEALKAYITGEQRADLPANPFARDRLPWTVTGVIAALGAATVLVAAIYVRLGRPAL